MVKINGENILADGKILIEYLIEAGYDLRTIAIELNGEIISKDDLGTKILNDGDVLEIITFMGGGNSDDLILGVKHFKSRFILGSGKYSMKLIEAAVKNAGAEMITVAVRRANTKTTENILDYIPKGVTLLPNTSGARNAQEAVRIARLARELGCGDFVKIEIMQDSKYLLPENYETIKATEKLASEGFIVLPYMFPDLNVARELVKVGAAASDPLTGFLRD